MLKRVFTFSLLIILLLSCILITNGVFAEEKFKVGYNHITTIEISQNIYYHRLKRLVEERGAEFISANAFGSDSAMVSNFDNLMQSGVDVIIQGTSRLEVMKRKIKEATEKGIPVFLLDTGYAEPAAGAVMGNGCAYAAENARYLVEYLDRKGKVAILHCDTQPWSIERTNVARAVFNIYPEIEIVYEGYINNGGDSLNQGMKIIESLLSKYPDLDGVWCAWDMPGIGAAEAIERAGADTVVVGADADPKATESVRNGGPFICTIRQDFEGMVDTIVNMVFKYLEEGKLPKNKIVVLSGIPYTLETVPPADAPISPDYKGK